MVKKNLGAGIDAIIGTVNQDGFNVNENKKNILGKKAEANRIIETRTTLYLEVELLEKLKALAYWERVLLKDVIKDSLEKHISSKGENYVNSALAAYREKN